MEITKHFTVSVYIYHQGKVLLHNHKSLHIWLPVGGHIDRDELPQDAALRETKEETGMEIQIGAKEENLSLDDTRVLVKPEYLLLETINQFHQHIDFVYYATTISDRVQPQVGESKEFRWVDSQTVDTLTAPDNVKAMVKEVCQHFAS